MTDAIIIYILQIFFLVYPFCSVVLSSFLMRRRERRVWMGLGRETFGNVGRVFVNVWAVKYFCSMVGVLNSLETNRQAPHIYLMDVLQALDNTEVFQKPKVHPRQIIAQGPRANGGRQRGSEEMTLVQDPKKPQVPKADSTTGSSFLVCKN